MYHVSAGYAQLIDPVSRLNFLNYVSSKLSIDDNKFRCIYMTFILQLLD